MWLQTGSDADRPLSDDLKQVWWTTLDRGIWYFGASTAPLPSLRWPIQEAGTKQLHHVLPGKLHSVTSDTVSYIETSTTIGLHHISCETQKMCACNCECVDVTVNPCKCLCVYVCVCACALVCVCLHLCCWFFHVFHCCLSLMYAFVYMCVCSCVYMCVCLHAYVCVHLCLCALVCICTCVSGFSIVFHCCSLPNQSLTGYVYHEFFSNSLTGKNNKKAVRKTSKKGSKPG